MPTLESTRVRPALGAATLFAALLASPALASSPADPGPTLGGAVAVGGAHTQTGPRLDARLQGWLPAPLLGLGPLRLGLEGSYAIEGDEGGGPCSFRPADDPRNAPPIVPEGTLAGTSARCIESGLGVRLLVGAEWGRAVIGRLEGGFGATWRQALRLDDGEATDSRWSTSMVGRAVGLVGVGRGLGGEWRLGLSAEISSLDAEAPAYAGGLVFEALVVD